LRLADVVVPNEVYGYLENSAAEDKSGGWEFRLSGKHFTADAHLLNQVRQLQRKLPNLRKNWEARCKRRLFRLMGADETASAIERQVTRPEPRIFAADHHLATGPAVGKSTAFAKWIQSENRKAVAMEMETAAVFDAVETEIQPRRRLAIRGISDFADERKVEVETSYKGKFRQLSHLNACDLFLTLIEGGVFHEHTETDDVRRSDGRAPSAENPCSAIHEVQNQCRSLIGSGNRGEGVRPCLGVTLRIR
jgi:nucleoside phosphorylase